jgi:hypothetical protein
MRRAALTIAAAFLAVASLASSALGNTFGEQDYQILRNLSRKIDVMNRDILDSQRALLYQPDSYECLNVISREIENVGANVSELSVLVSISGQMLNPIDESFVNRYITEGVKHGLNLLQLSRKSVNLSSGHCSSSAIVSTKAQYVLSLFTEIENALRLIERRV